MALADFPLIFRFNSPAGCKGKRCRRITFSPPARDRDGSVVFAYGDQVVTVEFTDERRVDVLRSAVVDATSRLGRQTVARLARGDASPCRAKQRPSS